jgi:hypothetical protein
MLNMTQDWNSEILYLAQNFHNRYIDPGIYDIYIAL